MRYIAFIKHPKDYRGIKPPAALMEAMGAFVGENLKKGKFVDGAGLQYTYRAKKVQLRTVKSASSMGLLPRVKRSSADTRSWKWNLRPRRSSWRGSSWSCIGCMRRTSRWSVSSGRCRLANRVPSRLKASRRRPTEVAA